MHMLATLIFAVLENPLTIPQILALSTIFQYIPWDKTDDLPDIK